MVCVARPHVNGSGDGDWCRHMRLTRLRVNPLMYEYMWCQAMVVGREWVSGDQRGNYVLKLAGEIEVVKESRA